MPVSPARPGWSSPPCWRSRDSRSWPSAGSWGRTSSSASSSSRPSFSRWRAPATASLRYYTGDPRYRAAGPPQLLLRLIAPVVVASTILVIATGIELWLFGLRFGAIWLTAHKLSFVIWFGSTSVHVLGYLARAPQLALADIRRDGAVPGALTRRSLVVASLLVGLALALATLPWQTPFLAPSSADGSHQGSRSSIGVAWAARPGRGTPSSSSTVARSE